MTRIIYLDIDGTLRDERLGITDGARNAFEECKSLGIRMAICTGRNPGSIQADVRKLEADAVISGGGCYIHRGGTCLRKRRLPGKAAEQARKAVEALGLGAAFETETDIFMNGRAASFYERDFKSRTERFGEEEACRIRRENRIRYEDNFSELPQNCEGIHKLCLIGERERVERAKAALLMEMAAVQERKWNGLWYLELLPAGCGKGEAVKFLNRLFGIEDRDSMGFGDGQNDLELLRAVGTGIAVEGAAEELRRAAASVCLRPADGGIERELARRGIIGRRRERKA